MLLTVAGVRSWSVQGDSGNPFKTETVSKDFSKQNTPDTGDQNQPKIAALSLDAVITPAISFDFSQYFYFLPQPTWQFEAKELVVRTAFRESFFLFSYFHRIFGRFIVTNAP